MPDENTFPMNPASDDIGLRRELEELRATVKDVELTVAAALKSTTPDFNRRLADRRTIRRIRDVMSVVLSPAATVAIISNGDDELVKLDGCCAYQCSPGTDRTDADVSLPDGVEFLLFPHTSGSYLEQHVAMEGYLRRRYRLIYREDATCSIFDLSVPSRWMPVMEWVVDFKRRRDRYPAILDWDTGADLARVFPECAVFAPPEPGKDMLPYIDESIDIVAATDRAVASEAHRVASDLVMIVPVLSTDPDPGPISVAAKHATEAFEATALR